MAPDRVEAEAGTGSNRLRDFFSSLSTNIGGALLPITENEQMASRRISNVPHLEGIAGFCSG